MLLAYVTPPVYRISHTSHFLSEVWSCDWQCVPSNTIPNVVRYLRSLPVNLKLSWMKIQRKRHCFALWSRSDILNFISLAVFHMHIKVLFLHISNSEKYISKLRGPFIFHFLASYFLILITERFMESCLFFVTDYSQQMPLEGNFLSIFCCHLLHHFQS